MGMEKRCDACAVILGEEYRGGENLCADCRSNRDVENEFQWYHIVWHFRRQTMVFIPTFTILLVVAMVMGAMRWWNALPCFISLALVIWQWRHYNFAKRLVESGEKMFLAKIAGTKTHPAE